jgi:phage shock protein C
MNEQVPEVIPPQGPKRLVRSRSKRMFLGVCGGLGEYFDIDPTVVRLLFVVGVFIGGTSIAVYAVLALIMPAQEAADVEPRVAAQATMNEALDEVQSVVTRIVNWVKGLFGRNTGSSAVSSTTPSTTTPAAPMTTGFTGAETTAPGSEPGTNPEQDRATGSGPTTGSGTL